MNVNLVATVCTGDYAKIGEITIPILEQYAHRVGADFVVIDDAKETAVYADTHNITDQSSKGKLQKFLLSKYLDTYERIMFLDCTCLTSPHCRNLFEMVPADKLGAKIELRFARDEKIRACKYYEVNLKNEFMFNSGVMVLSKIHKCLFELGNSIPPLRKMPKFDQPYLNAMFDKNDFELKDLGEKYNYNGSALRTLERKTKTPLDPNEVHIIHVTGGYRSDWERRLARIKKYSMTGGYVNGLEQRLACIKKYKDFWYE